MLACSPAPWVETPTSWSGWVLADRRPDVVEAVGEDGLGQVDADALPCDGQHAPTLCQAARLMCSGMHTPAYFNGHPHWGQFRPAMKPLSAALKQAALIRA